MLIFHLTANQKANLLPVVVFLHGESYDIGSGNVYEAAAVASFAGNVWVTLNYRLGALGWCSCFLSTKNDNSPGNYALLDQVAALHWVKENIRAFGGDPDRVTLIGHHYGAAMAHMLAVSPVTKGKFLFQRLILLGGTAFSSWSLQHNPTLYTQQLANMLNCS
ncbi:hypothetical protein HELRODRAFT_84683, partial [Helobdella robusta]|uniref:Carboxylesterase type B domain-containing protein n=1 Tax=Helobdella robusta TaxID=6412 RepID=T1G5M0_HELRO